MRQTHAVAPFPLARSSPRRPPRWLDRTAARLRGPRLDRQLADGVAPWRSPAHAARAVQVTSDRRRRALARALERLVAQSDQAPGPSLASAVIAPCRRHVRAALPEILDVCARLRSDVPVDPTGVVRLRDLLRDGAGPCYVWMHPDALTIELREVSRWLEVSD